MRGVGDLEAPLWSFWLYCTGLIWFLFGHACALCCWMGNGKCPLLERPSISNRSHRHSAVERQRRHRWTGVQENQKSRGKLCSGVFMRQIGTMPAREYERSWEMMKREDQKEHKRAKRKRSRFFRCFSLLTCSAGSVPKCWKGTRDHKEGKHTKPWYNLRPEIEEIQEIHFILSTHLLVETWFVFLLTFLGRRYCFWDHPQKVGQLSTCRSQGGCLSDFIGISCFFQLLCAKSSKILGFDCYCVGVLLFFLKIFPVEAHKCTSAVVISHDLCLFIFLGCTLFLHHPNA